MIPLWLSIVLFFVPIFIMLILSISDRLNYKKHFEQGWEEYWNHLVEDLPAAENDKNAIRVGYSAGYFQAFFRKPINK